MRKRFATQWILCLESFVGIRLRRGLLLGRRVGRGEIWFRGLGGRLLGRLGALRMGMGMGIGMGMGMEGWGVEMWFDLCNDDYMKFFQAALQYMIHRYSPRLS